MEDQNYNTLYQANQNTMLLEKKGTESSSKTTWHINICYYFVTDQIKKKQLEVKYCPTDDMIGDFMIKPLQGSKFKKFRNLIMGEVQMK